MHTLTTTTTTTIKLMQVQAFWDTVWTLELGVEHGLLVCIYVTWVWRAHSEQAVKTHICRGR